MTSKQAINFWGKSAQEDFLTAKALLENKRYPHCLFFCHLFIEKTLKALIVKKTKQNPPPIHNLLRLAQNTQLEFNTKQRELFSQINEFNIRARYDDFKFRFHKKATSAFTKKYFTKSTKLYQWLKKQ